MKPIKALFTQDHIESIVRSLLKAGGGAMIGHGSITSSNWETFSGVAIALVGFFFSYIDSMENPKPPVAPAGATAPKPVTLTTLLLLAGLGCLLATGCSTTLDPNGVFGKLPNGITVYQAENSVVAAYNAVDSFLLWETSNHALLALKYPQVAAAANDMRDHLEEWVNTADALVAAYKANPSTDNATKATQALAVLTAASQQAQQYLNTVKVN